MEQLRSSSSLTPVTALRVAGVVAALEGVGFLVLGVLELAHFSTTRVALGVTTTLFFLAYGGVLVLCAWAVTHGRGQGRSPLVVAQLIQVLLAWGLRDSTPAFAALLATSALVVAVCLVLPASTADLVDDPTGAGED